MSSFERAIEERKTSKNNVLGEQNDSAVSTIDSRLDRLSETKINPSEVKALEDRIEKKTSGVNQEIAGGRGPGSRPGSRHSLNHSP